MTSSMCLLMQTRVEVIGLLFDSPLKSHISCAWFKIFIYSFEFHDSVLMHCDPGVSILKSSTLFIYLSIYLFGSLNNLVIWKVI